MKYWKLCSVIIEGSAGTLQDLDILVLGRLIFFENRPCSGPDPRLSRGWTFSWTAKPMTVPSYGGLGRFKLSWSGINNVEV